MTYVVSNLFGRLERFNKLLEKISFKDSDVMYVLGNIVDYGEESIELVSDLSMRYNVYSVLGEHDYKAYMLLSEFDRILKNGGAPSAEFSSKMIEWSANGGMSTLEAFKDADDDTKEGFLEYLSELPVFEEADVKGKEYVLVSAGIDNFDAKKDLSEYALEDFIRQSFDLDKNYYRSKNIIVGYLGYEYTPDWQRGKINSKNGNFALACDMSENDEIVCLCLENSREYYV